MAFCVTFSLVLPYSWTSVQWSSIALTVAPVRSAFWLWISLWSERNLLSFAFQHVVCEIFTSWKDFWKFMPAVFNSVKASRDLWCLLLTCDRMFTSKHTSGAGVPFELVTTLKTTDLLCTRTNKCMHGSFLLFLNEKGMGQPFSVFSCLCLTDQQHEFTWTQTKEAETRKNKLLSNQIFMFHQNQNSPSDSSGTVQSDLSGTVTVMEYGSVLMCLCVWVNCCHYILECVFEWQGNVSFLHCISTLTTVLDLQHHLLNLLEFILSIVFMIL